MPVDPQSTARVYSTESPEARAGRVDFADAKSAEDVDTTAPPSTTPNGHAPGVGDAVKGAMGSLNEAKTYLGHYVAAKVDGITSTARNVAIYAALGVVAGVVGLAAVGTAAVLLMTGLAGALGVLFGDRFWLGNIVLGVVVLGGIGVGAWLGLSSLTGKFKASTVAKYEDKKRAQRAQYGHDVEEKAHVS